MFNKKKDSNKEKAALKKAMKDFKKKSNKKIKIMKVKHG